MTDENVDFSFEEVNMEREGVIRLPPMNGKHYSSQVEAYTSQVTYGDKDQWRLNFGLYRFFDIKSQEGESDADFNLIIEPVIDRDKRTHSIYLTTGDGQEVITSKLNKAKPLDTRVNAFLDTCKSEFLPAMKPQETIDFLQDVRTYIANDKEGNFKETLIADQEDTPSDSDSDYLLRCRGYDVTETDSAVIKFKEKIKRENDSNVIQFLQEQIPNLILDEESNIMKKILMSFSTMLGLGSYFDVTLGDAQEGKSLMIETTLNYFIPSEYWRRFNEVTEAYFVNNAIDDPHCYDRMVLNLGDMGNEDRFAKMNGLFDIAKILCTEKIYESGKSRKGEKDWESESIYMIADSICISYSSVRKGRDSNTDQISSRAIESTPKHIKSIETYSFNNEKDVIGTTRQAKFERTVKNLELFQKYLLYLTNKFYYMNQDVNEDGMLIHKRVQVYNPFEKLFYELGASDDVGIRNAGLLSKLLTSFTILNWEKSHKFEKEIPLNEEEIYHITYLFPRIDDLNSFIDIVSDSAGVNPRLKESMKALTENLLIIDEEIEDPKTHIADDKPILDAMEKIEEKTLIDEDDDSPYPTDSINPRKISNALLKDRDDEEETTISILELAMIEGIYKIEHDKNMSLGTIFMKNEELLSEFYDVYGLTQKNRKNNRQVMKALKETKDEEKRLELVGQYKPMIFFTVTTLKKNLQVKGIKGVTDLADILHDAYEDIERAALFHQPIDIVKHQRHKEHVDDILDSKIEWQHNLQFFVKSS